MGKFQIAGLLLRLAHAARSRSLCSITDFGAIGDNVTDCTSAIQTAISSSACSTVVVPTPGWYLSKSISLVQASNKTMLIQPGAALVLWRNISEYGKGDFLQSAALLQNFTLTGGGSIIGGGATWWPFGKTIFRPRILGASNVSGLAVTNLTFVDSPFWNMGLRGDDILVENMVIVAGAGNCDGYASAPNTDGVNIGGRRITVRNVSVHNGDDCIPVNGQAGGFTDDVRVSNVRCSCGTNGGVVYDNGGRVQNVIFSNMTVNGTNQGAGVKIGSSQNNATGGLVVNVTWEGISITHPRNAALYIDMFGEDVPNCALPSDPARPDWLTAQNVTFRDISATVAEGQIAGCFICAPTRPCEGFLFDGVSVTSAGGGSPGPYKCFNFVDATSTGGSSPVPCGVQ